MIDENLKHSFAKDVVLLKLVGMNPIIVHGGGPQINKNLDSIGKKGEFHNGMRITDKATMGVVYEVLNSINIEIVELIKENGGDASSLSEKKSLGFIKSKKLLLDDNNVDLGYVGEIESIDEKFINSFITNKSIPVIAPIGIGQDGQAYNINADVVAGKIAEVTSSEKLVLMTNTKGVLDKNKKLITGIKADEVDGLIKSGILSGGMLPKIQSAVHAAKSKVNSVHIIDGRVEHALLLEILTDQGVGTLIKSH
jgi:acetylglutamate kinase